MKTSFYFVIWIIIYPLLGLLGSEAIDRNAFLFALIIVWGISWILNRSMPDTLRYEAVSERLALAEDVYAGRIEKLRRHISGLSIVEFVTAVYFGVTFVFLLFMMIKGYGRNWLGLVVFGLFGVWAIRRAYALSRAAARLRGNPDPSESVELVESLFGVSYSSYYETRRNMHSPADMLPPRPPHYKAFQILSLIIAVVCAILGVIFIVIALVNLIGRSSPEVLTGAIMNLLYGSLAAYYGTKDSISTIASLINKS